VNISFINDILFNAIRANAFMTILYTKRLFEYFIRQKKNRPKMSCKDGFS